ncbi:MAG: DNA recombination protein RmuC [Candidatus Bipolaricaulota bacterium]|nr:DNA recombination protein RmuC [Candidatus Bipolaricaulota bacterium]MDW8152573.1 DNA recombination protein RmuC [Candidatus Bipolaricaulota bacterium]
MTAILVAAVALLSLFFLGLAIWERNRQRALEENIRRAGEDLGKLATALQNLQDQVVQHLSLTAQLLRGQDQNISERLSAVQGIVADLRERMGKVEEISRRVEGVAQDLSGLQDLLRGPKARGAFGEWVLSEILAEVLPHGRFQEQYRFPDGSTVDAAIFLENCIVPVDAKFPLSGFEELRAASSPEERKRLKKNFIRSAQKHVDTIAQKYIKPEAGTADFALMYIPAEGVFLELLIPEEGLDFLEYAWDRRVFPCSPNSFYSYLRAISMGLRGLELAKNVQALFRELRTIETTLEGALKDFETLGNHLRNARSKWEDAEKSFRDVRERLAAIARKEEG